MECQYNNCTNIGAISCPICGKLVCGMHFKGVKNQISRCKTCFLAHRRGQLMMGGIGVSILGVLCMFGISGGIVLGIGLFIFGVFSLFIGYTGRTGIFFTKEI